MTLAYVLGGVKEKSEQPTHTWKWTAADTGGVPRQSEGPGPTAGPAASPPESASNKEWNGRLQWVSQQSFYMYLFQFLICQGSRFCLLNRTLRQSRVEQSVLSAAAPRTSTALHGQHWRHCKTHATRDMQGKLGNQLRPRITRRKAFSGTETTVIMS